MICPFFPAPFLFFISSDVPTLLYYSHVPIFFISIFVAVFVLIRERFSLLSRALAIPLLLFDLWIICDLITWVNNSSDTIMFVWSFFGLLLVLISFSLFRFLYIFIKNKELPFYLYLIYFIVILPIILLTYTSFNLTGFDLVLCTSLEKDLFVNYYHGVGFLISIYTCLFLIRSYRNSDPVFKKEILLMGIGAISFLFTFLLASFSGSLLKYLGLVENYSIEQYGFYPMIIFIIGLGYLTIRYKVFNLKLIATQALIWGLVALIGSQFFFIKIPINFVLNGIGFLAAIILGQFLVKSVKKEIQQKEELEKLTAYLEVANTKLKAFDILKSKFLSLASHQLRNPISAIISCTSMFLDGSFGKIDDTQTKMLKQMFDRAKGMNDDVEKYLTIAKVDQGGLQYNLEKLDLEDFAKNITEQQKLAVEKRKLTISFETDGQSSYFVSGDKVQLKQVLQNLIDNAMKFTKEGWIKVRLSKDEGAHKIRVAISDSGVGIKPEIMPTLFKEFSRGEGAKTDVGGSGIGIYLAKEIIEKGHNGKIWAESLGAGKGSTFIFELPEYKLGASN